MRPRKPQRKGAKRLRTGEEVGVAHTVADDRRVSLPGGEGLRGARHSDGAGHRRGKRSAQPRRGVGMSDGHPKGRDGISSPTRCEA